MNLLTPRDVHNTKFNVRRLQAGYDMDEVDEFLDEIEATITMLTSPEAKILIKKLPHKNTYIRSKK